MPAVLFVCTGNICRSPTAHWVLAEAVERRGKQSEIAVDSAGTHGYHIGEPADERAITVAARHDVDMTSHRARQVVEEDFRRFDLIVALDQGHYKLLKEMSPDDARAELRLFMDFTGAAGTDVADPYYGDVGDFELMMEHIQAGVEKILLHLTNR